MSGALKNIRELYIRNKCHYCEIVIDIIDELGIHIDYRNISTSKQYKKRLVANCGRATVPVLYYIADNGKDCWLSESDEIIRHLLQTHG